MKKNQANKAEIVDFYLNETNYPIAYNGLLNDLIENGLTAEDAKKYIANNPIHLEVYYASTQGVFMVEVDAVSCAEIFNPYDGQLMEECEL